MQNFSLPYIEQGFGTQYHGTQVITGFYYDISQQLLYTFYPTNIINSKFNTLSRGQTYDIYVKVPLSIAQQFAVADFQLGGSYRNPNIPNPDFVYTQQVENNFYQSLMTENGGALLTETGDYIVLKPAPILNHDYYVTEDDVFYYVTENGLYNYITENG